MGRAKLQIKKIENTTNRQVTFSKRRNGLLKKAYELSTLCDIDIALIMFSPSGRVSLFSGKRRIEDVLGRFVNLPEHERGRLLNQESLLRTLEKLRAETELITQVTSARSFESQVEDLQNEINRCQYELEDAEKRLRIFEGDPIRINSLREAEYHEQILEEALNRVRMHKQVLDGKRFPAHVQPTAQVFLRPQNVNVNGFIGNPNHSLNWLPPRDPQVQILNFLDSNGLLHMRQQTPPLAEFMTPPSTVLHGNGMHIANHASPNNGVEDSGEVHHPEFGHVNANMPQWNGHYPTGNNSSNSAEPREQAILELFLSQFKP